MKHGGASVLGLGTLIGVTVPALVSPALTRVYRPEDFANLALVTSTIILSTTASNGARETVIPRAPVAARQLVVRSGLRIAISTGIGAAVVLLLLASGTWNRDALPLIDVLAGFAPLVGVGIAVYGAAGIAVAQALASQRTTLVALHRAAGPSVIAAVQLGAYSLGSLGIVAGQVLGQIPSTAWLLRRGRATGQGNPPYQASAELHGMLVRASRQTAPAAVLNGLSIQAIPFVIAGAYGLRTAGLYALVHRVLAAPAAVVGRALSEESIASAAVAIESGQVQGLKSRARKRVLALAIAGCCGLLIVATAGAALFREVFGAEWEEAGQIALYIGPLYVAQLVAAPTSRLLPILNKDRIQLNWELARVLGLAGAVVTIGTLDLGIAEGLSLIAWWLVVMYAIQVLVVFRVVDAHGPN